MPSNKRILVKESGLMNFFRSFFKAKASGTESQWLQNVRKKDPRIADAFKDYDDELSKSISMRRAMLTKYGISTKGLDDFVKKYGIK